MASSMLINLLVAASSSGLVVDAVKSVIRSIDDDSNEVYGNADNFNYVKTETISTPSSSTINDETNSSNMVVTQLDESLSIVPNEVIVNQLEDPAECEEELIHFINNDNLDASSQSRAVSYLESLFEKSDIHAQIVISRAYLTALKTNDTKLINGILYVISSFRYEEVYPIGQTIAIAAINLKDRESAANAIRAFEYWKKPEAITFLEQIDVASPWIHKYKTKVIESLKERDERQWQH